MQQVDDKRFSSRLTNERSFAVASNPRAVGVALYSATASRIVKMTDDFWAMGDLVALYAPSSQDKPWRSRRAEQSHFLCKEPLE